MKQSTKDVMLFWGLLRPRQGGGRMKVCDRCKDDDWVEIVKIPGINDFDLCGKCRIALKEAVIKWYHQKNNDAD